MRVFLTARTGYSECGTVHEKTKDCLKLEDEEESRHIVVTDTFGCHSFSYLDVPVVFLFVSDTDVQSEPCGPQDDTQICQDSSRRWTYTFLLA